MPPTFTTLAKSDFDVWRDKHYPRGFSHALDTTGNKAVFENTISCLATGGEMAFAILPAPMEEFAFKPFETIRQVRQLESRLVWLFGARRLAAQDARLVVSRSVSRRSSNR